MSIQIQVKGDVRRQLDGLPKALRRAEVAALNRTAGSARKYASQAVRGDVNLPARYVNRHLSVIKANRHRRRAVLKGRFRATLLYRYRARVLTRKVKHPKRSRGFPKYNIPPGRKFAGVSVAVRKGGPRKKIRSGFLMELKNSGATGLMQRSGKGAGDFKSLYGPSVSQVMEWNEDEITRFIERELAIQFHELLPRELHRAGL